jgi:hypothetical protein
LNPVFLEEIAMINYYARATRAGLRIATLAVFFILSLSLRGAQKWTISIPSGPVGAIDIEITLLDGIPGDLVLIKPAPSKDNTIKPFLNHGIQANFSPLTAGHSDFESSFTLNDSPFPPRFDHGSWTFPDRHDDVTITKFDVKFSSASDGGSTLGMLSLALVGAILVKVKIADRDRGKRQKSQSLD